MGKKYRKPTTMRDRQCALCGYFFTSQGLSGHVRYAHKDVNGNEGLKQLADLQERKQLVIAYAQGLGLTDDAIAQARLWMEDWQRLVFKAHIFQIRLTEPDFKSYILKRLTDETLANQARGGSR